MAEDQPRLLLVVGATGKQGKSVCKHLLKRGWKVRAMVRDTTKSSAQQLASLGADLCAGDLDKPETLPALVNGITHAFVNTVYDMESGTETWEDEVRRGEAISDALASVRSNLQAVVYSNQEFAFTNPAELPVHMRAKALVSQHMKSNNLPMIFIALGFYLENFDFGWPLTRHLFSRRLHWWFLPFEKRPHDVRMPSIGIGDCGGIVGGLLEQHERFLGQSINGICENITLGEILNIFSEEIDEPVDLEPLTMAQFNKMPIPQFFLDGALLVKWMHEEPGQVFSTAVVREMHENEARLDDQAALCKELFPEIKSVRQWARENKEVIRHGSSATMFTALGRYVKVAEFVSRPVVATLLVVGLGAIGYSVWKKRQDS